VLKSSYIQIETFTGGTAVWMADMLHLIEMDSSIYLMDIKLSFLEDQVKEINSSQIMSPS